MREPKKRKKQNDVTFIAVSFIPTGCIRINTLTMNTLKTLVLLILAFFALFADVTSGAPVDAGAAGVPHGNVLPQAIDSETSQRFRCGEALV